MESGLMNQRYVVARYAFGGIGDHVSCLIGAWWLAKRTGRTLVIDWRGSRFNADPSGKRNCFLDYFSLEGPMLAGVPTIADQRVSDIEYQLPIYPEKWSIEALASSDHLRHTAVEIESINGLVTGDDDRSEPTVVLNQWIDPHPPREFVRELLMALVPADEIAKEAEAFRTSRKLTMPTIAIHVRHGNGENIGHRAAYWLGPWTLVRQYWRNSRVGIHREGLSGRFSDNMPDSFVGSPGQRRYEVAFYRRIAKEVRRLAELSGLEDARPILFADAPHIERDLAEFLPDLVAFPKAQLPEGSGPLHQLEKSTVEVTPSGRIRSKGIQARITHEMFVEIELMRRCRALVCMDSGFSIFSQRELDASRVIFLKPTNTNILIEKVTNRLFR